MVRGRTMLSWDEPKIERERGEEGEIEEERGREGEGGKGWIEGKGWSPWRRKALDIGGREIARDGKRGEKP